MRLRRILGHFALLAVALAAGAPRVAAQDVFEYPVDGHPERAAALQELSGNLAEQGRVDGDFVQEKFLTILEQPLRSYGSFVFSDGVIVWQVKAPFAITYRYKQGDLYKQDGVEQTLVRPGDDPMLHGFFAFFSSLFDMSLEELGRLFKIYFTARGEGWVVGLEPKRGFLRSAISAIEVEGKSLRTDGHSPTALVIERVIIREPDGDRSQLLFSY